MAQGDFHKGKILKFITHDELTLTGEAWGYEDKPPVILLHGGGQTRHSWGDTAHLIAQEGWYAIAYDTRGHGDSDWAKDGQYDMERLTADLKAVLGQVPGTPALVGASLGGITSLVTQGENPQEKLSSAIVLVDIAPKVEQKGIERIFKFMSANLDGFTSLEAAAEAVANYLPNRKAPKDVERLKKNLRLKEDGRYYWHWDPKILERWKSQDANDQRQFEWRLFMAAKNLSIPTLIVRGGMSDVVSEKVMAEFLDAVPHVRSVNVSGAGHMVAGDSNNAFTKAVTDFLREVYPPNPK